MKIICILFHIGKNKNVLSRDSKWRLWAGFELAKRNENSIILFIGGHELRISGAKLMRKYWTKNFSNMKNQCFLLESSNNTYGNLREIKVFLNDKSRRNNIKLIIISSSYHIKRLGILIKKLGLKATILSSEKILIKKNIDKEEIKNYLRSLCYKKKIAIEWFLRLLLLIDPNQKMIQFWRSFSYRKILF